LAFVVSGAGAGPDLRVTLLRFFADLRRRFVRVPLVVHTVSCSEIVTNVFTLPNMSQIPRFDVG
jgi:hypothetical protein